jgi:uncharacterized OsmC-like protein
MIQIKSRYAGDLRTTSVHLKSGNEIITDAPIDNNGKGEAFSPTDLVCAALGSCMSTIMGIYANKNQIELPGFEYEIEKIMHPHPRKISKVRIVFHFAPNNLSEQQKEALKNAALHCPVALSLHPDLVQDVTFHF